MTCHKQLVGELPPSQSPVDSSSRGHCPDHPGPQHNPDWQKLKAKLKEVKDSSHGSNQAKGFPYCWKKLEWTLQSPNAPEGEDTREWALTLTRFLTHSQIWRPVLLLTNHLLKNISGATGATDEAQMLKCLPSLCESWNQTPAPQKSGCVGVCW